MQATAPSALQVFLRAATNLRSATLALSGGGAGTLPWQRMPPKSALLLLLPQQDVASTPHAAALGSWAVSQGLTGLSQTQHLTSRTTGSRPYSQPTTDGAHARGSNASTASSSSNGSRGRAAGGESGNAGARRSGEGTAASGAASASAAKQQGGGGWKKGGYWQKHKKREWNGQGGKGWGNSGEAVRAAESRGAGGGSQDQDGRRQGSGGPGAQDTVKGEAKVLAQASSSSSSSSSTVGDAGGVARLEGHGEGGIATAGQPSEAGAAQVTPAVIAVQPREVLQRGQYTLRLYDLPQRCRTAEEERCLEAALEVVRRLRQGNHSALFAGGWVRDQFMGRPSYDIDIATNADWYQVMQLFGPSYGGGGGGAGAVAGAGAGGGGGATLASSGRCRYKGGTTVDVSVGYHTFEVTSFRGGTRDPGEEAEWRDAALRDFTINALFFEPELPPAAAASAKPQQQQQQKEQPMPSGAAAAPPPPTTTTTGAQSPSTTHEAGGDPSAPAVAPAPEASAASAAPPPAAASEAPVPAPPADPQSLQTSQATTPTPAPAPPAASPQPLQLRGVVKDYVGGVEDLERRVLRVYPHFRLLGHSQSSVEADPIRVLRAARMAEDLGLAVHPHSEALIRRAAPLVRVSEAELGDADKAPGSRQYVTRSRVLRELAKMNDMDVRHVGSTAAVASPAAGASKHEQDGGAANGGGDGSGGGSGSVRFGAALERCREWGALEALLPKLQQAGLPQVLTGVFPRLPAALPLELKLACLVVGHGPLPSSTLEQYENVRLLTGEAQRPAQTPWCHMLCNLTALMREDKMAARCKVLWRELLARRQTDLVVQAFGAFVPPTALPGLHELVEAHRATLLQDKQQQQQQGQEQRQQQQQFYGRQQQQQRYKAGTRDGGRQ